MKMIKKKCSCLINWNIFNYNDRNVKNLATLRVAIFN